MSLEELVAALPEAAVGDLVDIFSSTGITPGRRSQHAHAQLATHALPKAGSFSCMVCKKNFGTEATWNAHQKTARHLSAVKEELKRERSEAKKTASNPVVADAQMKARQIDKVASSNPSLAATVLWSVGRTFWEHKRIQDAAAALWKLIGILCGLQDTPRIQTPEAVTLSPSQVTETLYLARIALARIMVQYHEDFAIGLYLDAIEGKFGSWTEEALMIAQMDSFTSALAFSRNVLDNYILPHAVSKKNEDPAAAKRRLSVNLRKVQSIFLEIAGVAAATESIADSTMFRLLALAISEAEARSVDYAKTCLNLADNYLACDQLWSACEALESAADTVKGADLADDDASTLNASTSLISALVLAMSADDRVRIERLSCKVRESPKETLDLPHVQFLLRTAHAILNLDYQWFTAADGGYLKETSLHSVPKKMLNMIDILWRKWTKT